MDIALIILGSICLLLSLIGCVLPILPGPPLAYAGILLLHLTDKVQFTATQLIVWLLVVTVIQLLDYFTPIIGVKRYGGGKWGNWGCLIGTVVGIFLFPPWGIIIGPLLGAIAGELLAGKKADNAFKAGLGAFVGFMFGTVLKLITCGVLIFFFIRALL